MAKPLRQHVGRVSLQQTLSPRRRSPKKGRARHRLLLEVRPVCLGCYHRERHVREVSLGIFPGRASRGVREVSRGSPLLEIVVQGYPRSVSARPGVCYCCCRHLLQIQPRSANQSLEPRTLRNHSIRIVPALYIPLAPPLGTKPRDLRCAARDPRCRTSVVLRTAFHENSAHLSHLCRRQKIREQTIFGEPHFAGPHRHLPHTHPMPLRSDIVFLRRACAARTRHLGRSEDTRRMLAGEEDVRLVALLQHAPDGYVHRDGVQNSEVSEKFQRSEVHWLHHVLHLLRLDHLLSVLSQFGRRTREDKVGGQRRAVHRLDYLDWVVRAENLLLAAGSCWFGKRRQKDHNSKSLHDGRLGSQSG